MNHVIIGTAGHVDHGKTRLIQALTGVDTDRLPEEKARGLTIEPGFAPLNFPDGLQAGIVDVPGHEKFVRHMLCGAGGMDFVLLVIAADEGVMPQTAEHLEILNLLGIRDGLVVLTKSDLANRVQLEQTAREARALVRCTFLEGKPLLPVSVRTGQGIPELRELLHRSVLCAPARDLRRPFRLPVDRVFTVAGFGTVVTGTLLDGILCRDTPAEVFPAGRIGRVRGLQVFGRDVESAQAGQRVAVNLTGLKKEDLHRGDTLSPPGSLSPSPLLDVRLTALPSASLRGGTPLYLYHGSAVRTARAVLLAPAAETLAPGKSDYAQLRLSEPLAARAGDRFVLRIPSPPKTAGGGVILDAAPPKRRRSDPTARKALAVREHGSLSQRILQVLETSREEQPLPSLAAALSLPEESLSPALAALCGGGQVLELRPGHYLASASLELLRTRCRRVLESYHSTHPLQPGIRAAELRQQAGLSPASAPALLTLLVRESTLCRTGDRYALPSFRIALTRRQASIRRTMLALCAGMGRHTPTPAALAAKFPLGEREDCHRVLEQLLAERELVLLAPEVLCHAGDLAAYRRAAADWFAAHETMTLAQYRDLLGVSRDYALLILEYFDRCGITLREGDLRRAKPAAEDTPG